MTISDPPDKAARMPGAADPSTDGPSPKGRPPVVLQVLPRLQGGGVERGTIDVAAALVSVGWEAVVASEGGAMVRELARHGVAHVEMPLATKNPFVMRANAGRLARVIGDYGVDIVHARSRAPAWSAEAAAKRTGRHFMTTFHGTYNAGFGLKKAYNAVMTRGERVIAISEFIARHIVSTYRMDPARVRLIHRGVDVDMFDPAGVTQERMIQLSTRWQLPDGVRVLLLPGRFSRWKGHLLLVEALARLGRRDVRCVMVGADTGSADYLNEIKVQAEQRGVRDLIQFVDFCRDMPAAYMLSDVVISAAIEPEAFGRTLAEAMAMGRPVVGPRHGGAPEIIEDGRTGWLYAPGNSESLAGALHKALALDENGRRGLAADGMARVRTMFNNQGMCEQTLAVYTEILTGADAPVVFTE